MAILSFTKVAQPTLAAQVTYEVRIGRTVKDGNGVTTWIAWAVMITDKEAHGELRGPAGETV